MGLNTALCTIGRGAARGLCKPLLCFTGLRMGLGV